MTINQELKAARWNIRNAAVLSGYKTFTEKRDGWFKKEIFVFWDYLDGNAVRMNYIALRVYDGRALRLSTHISEYDLPVMLREIFDRSTDSFEISFLAEEADEVATWLFRNFYKVETLPSFYTKKGNSNHMVIGEPIPKYFWTDEGLKYIDRLHKDRP